MNAQTPPIASNGPVESQIAATPPTWAAVFKDFMLSLSMLMRALASVLLRFAPQRPLPPEVVAELQRRQGAASQNGTGSPAFSRQG